MTPISVGLALVLSGFPSNYFFSHCVMSAGVCEGRTMQDDSMDGIGSVESGTEVEQLSRMSVNAVISKKNNAISRPENELNADTKRSPRQKDGSR